MFQSELNWHIVAFNFLSDNNFIFNILLWEPPFTDEMSMTEKGNKTSNNWGTWAPVQQVVSLFFSPANFTFLFWQ
jgi:hypothetical protein